MKNNPILLEGLILMSAPPGAGKSTILKQLPEGVVHSSDKYRNLLFGCKYGQMVDEWYVYPYHELSDLDDRAVFALLEQAVESRLKHGLPTVVDVTAVSDKQRARWYEIAAKYSVPFTIVILDVSKETCLARNELRRRHVPEEVIENFYSRFTKSSVYSHLLIDTDKPVVFKYPYNVIEYPEDKLYVAGDLHGAYEQFAELYQELIAGTDNRLIVLGDFLDRGEDSIPLLESMRFLQKDGHYILLGNHEYNVLQLLEGKGDNIPYNSSSRKTARDILLRGEEYVNTCISFLKSLPDHYVLKQHDSLKYIFVHADIDYFDVLNQPKHSRVKGKSKLNRPYDSDSDFDKFSTFTSQFKQRVTLVRGHLPLTNPNVKQVISLETGAGFGGPVTFMKLDTKEMYSSTNTVDCRANRELSVFEQLKQVPAKYWRYETYEGFSIVKYSKAAFYDSKVFEQYPILKEARGLVLDINGDPVAPSFKKIPNLREEDKVLVDLTKYDELYAVEKYNGYLVQVTKHPYKKSLIVSSSGSFISEHVSIAKGIIWNNKMYPVLLDWMYSSPEIKSAQFECITPKDPHIVDYYGYEGLVLIGINGKNALQQEHVFKLRNYDLSGIKIPEALISFDPSSDLHLAEAATAINSEGFVLYDKNGDGVCKLKTPWYLFCKYIARMKTEQLVKLFKQQKLSRQFSFYNADMEKTIEDAFKFMALTGPEQFCASSEQERLSILRRLF